MTGENNGPALTTRSQAAGVLTFLAGMGAMCMAAVWVWNPWAGAGVGCLLIGGLYVLALAFYDAADHRGRQIGYLHAQHQQRAQVKARATRGVRRKPRRR